MTTVLLAACNVVAEILMSFFPVPEPRLMVMSCQQIALPDCGSKPKLRVTLGPFMIVVCLFYLCSNLSQHTVGNTNSRSLF